MRLDATVAKGFSTLEALIQAGRPMGISALSEELGIGRSNVHRLLNTMVELGYVKKNSETRQYSLTLKVWELGCMVSERDPFTRIARPIMLDILNDLGETVYLSTLAGTDVLYLEQFLTTRLALVAPRGGRRAPVLYTASGKVLVAHREDRDDIVDLFLQTSRHAAGLNRETVLRELKAIRKAGYAITESGWTRGMNSIAVPIIHREGEAIAALGVATFPDSVALSALTEFVPRLMRSAAEISAALGSDLYDLAPDRK